MSILLLFAFISGLVTIAAPCVWPLLPIILSSTATGGKKKPLGITLGVMVSFAFFTLALSYILKVIPFDPDSLRLFAVIVLGILGLTLIIPQLSLILEGWVSRLSSRFGVQNNQSSGFLSGLITGFFLGIIWSPCAGPILATIATLAATQQVNLRIILVTIFYVLGIGIPLFIFATLGNVVFTKVKIVSKYTGIIQQVFGVILILTAVAIFFNWDKALQAKLLNSFPSYSNYLTNIENQPQVKKQLDSLSGKSSQTNYGVAPEFVGISKWLNVDKPLTLADLKGKVVLVDFWTYTCINCIRTLPYVTSWYDKYHDKGFVVIGVHTPEFEFEKKTDNILNALKQYNIHYPVAQDNDYATWNAYNNQYWPAEYLIDSKGIIRHTHFGEGEYNQTEKAIQDLLKEAGQNADMPLSDIADQTPKSQLTPETYLGLAKRERYSSFKNLSVDQWTLDGQWAQQDEYIASKSSSTLDFKFLANKVFLIITPTTSSDIIKVSLDGKLTNTITASEAKLYTLVNLSGAKTSHLLHMDFQTPGTKIYAFTFGD